MTTTFTTLTFGGSVQENSSKGTSAVCALCCTMTSTTNFTGTSASGGADRESAQEDLGGIWTNLETCTGSVEKRTRGKCWDIMPFPFKLMASSSEQKPQNTFLFLHILCCVVLCCYFILLFVTFVWIVNILCSLFTIMYLKEIVFLVYTILNLFCVTMYGTCYVVCMDKRFVLWFSTFRNMSAVPVWLFSVFTWFLDFRLYCSDNFWMTFNWLCLPLLIMV